MSRNHVDHRDILRFAEEKVNLPRDKANIIREQARRVREKVEDYVSEHENFALRKILLSGSLAKGTALRTLNDVDMACYISGADAPYEVQKLLDYLADRLRKIYPNVGESQVRVNTYSVTLSFRGSGNDIDVVPILYDGDPDWYGNLISQEDGSFLKTCIPRHLDFIKRRKAQNQVHFAQVVRLAKYWARNLKQERSDFKFKSFMIELLMAKLSDDGVDFTDYPEALQKFFTYIAKSNIREQVAFSDYYSLSKIGSFTEPVKMIDPVNEKNNASKLYSDFEANAIVDAALDAGDAIDAALAAPTKEKTIHYWQKVFGPTFQI